MLIFVKYAHVRGVFVLVKKIHTKGTLITIARHM
jgi:hypothetical protein